MWGTTAKEAASTMGEEVGGDAPPRSKSVPRSVGRDPGRPFHQFGNESCASESAVGDHNIDEAAVQVNCSLPRHWRTTQPSGGRLVRRRGPSAVAPRLLADADVWGELCPWQGPQEESPEECVWPPVRTSP